MVFVGAVWRIGPRGDKWIVKNPHTDNEVTFDSKSDALEYVQARVDLEKMQGSVATIGRLSGQAG